MNDSYIAVRNLAQSKFYQMIAYRLLMLVETNPHLSKKQLIVDASNTLQMDQTALELAYDLECESE